MSFGAAYIYVKRVGAGQIVDPRPFAAGSIKDVFTKYNQLHAVLPAMGYSESQVNNFGPRIIAECARRSRSCRPR